MNGQRVTPPGGEGKEFTPPGGEGKEFTPPGGEGKEFLGPSAGETRWQDACSLVGAVHDILHQRPHEEAPPAWAIERGWAEALAALTADEVERCEDMGLPRALRVGAVTTHLPGSLRELAAAVASIEPPFLSPALPPVAVRGAADRRASERKRAQVSAFVAAAQAVVGERGRIVDVGSGHGHLTRQLARAFQLPAVGLERDERRADVANALTQSSEDVRTISMDATHPGFALRADDLAVGLHACGELGDLLAQKTASAGSALALVPCCPQKRRAAARAPLCVPKSLTAAALTLKREVLGVANVAPRGQGVEAPLALTLESRRKRLMMITLLRMRGLAVAPGEEMRGVNRRHGHDDEEALATEVLARRGQPPATPSELAAARISSQKQFAALRRWQLPRDMLGRLLEVFIVLDRARYLQEHGHQVHVGVLFAQDTSPRNLMLLARSP